MKNILKFLFVFALLMTFSSCDQDPEIFDAVNGQTLAQFSLSSSALPTPETGASTSVDVLVTTVSTSSRSISLEVNSASTATSDMYSLSSLEIPANSHIGTITITSNFNALPESGSVVLVLDLVGVGTGVSLVENNTFSVEMFRKCPIVLEDLVGTWSGDGSWSVYFGYPSEIVTAIDGSGNLTMNGLAFGWFQGWWGEVIVDNSPLIVTMDTESGDFTIEEQYYISSTWNGNPQPTYNMIATGKILNSCERTMEVSPVFIQAGSPIDGTAWGVPFYENVQLDD